MNDKSNEKILLFIPSYNCEKQIPRVLAQLNGEILSYISEVIVVNNRSTDGTEEAAIAYAKQQPGLPVRVLRNDENYGLGGSHKVAFGYAAENGFDYIIVLHGDDQGSIQDLLPILQSGSYRNHDCCLGSRFMRGSTLPGYSAFRTFGNRMYNVLFSIATGRRIYDLGSGLNMYSTKMLQNKFYLRFSDTLSFNCYMLLAASYYKHSLMFFPISWREDDQVSNVKLLRQAGQTFKIALRYFFSHKYILSEFRPAARESYTAQVVFENSQKDQ